MATIADLFSYIDSQKRRLSDTVQNPVLSLMQALGNANDQARTFNQAQQAAASEFIKTKQLGGPAQKNVDRMMAESLAPAGMTVYHGSPYRFTAFDPAKIGTGEGNQAYGHGLYVAENPAVAKGYQEALSKKSPEAIEYMNKLSQQDDLASKVAASKLQDVDHPQIAIEQLKDSIKSKSTPKEHIPIYQSAIEKLEKTPASGNLYKIDLPDEHIDKMVEFEQPLDEMDAKLASVINPLYQQLLNQPNPSLFKNLKSVGDVIQYSNAVGLNPHIPLSQAGYPGIKYLDEGSRNPQKTYHVGSPAKGFGDYTQFDNKLDALNQLSVLKNFGLHDAELKEQIAPQTRNFVVFPGNEDILKIQDVNGNPIQQ